MIRFVIRSLILVSTFSFVLITLAPVASAAKGDAKNQPKKNQSASQKRKVSNTDDVHVIQMDADLPIEYLSADGVTVHPLNQDQPGGIPSREVRDQIFFKAGLYKDVAQWDDLAKDMLFMKSEYKSAQELKKAYPQLDPEKIQKLKILIQEFRQWER